MQRKHSAASARRDETSPRFNENVSEHRRSTPARNDKWNFQIALSRADCRRDRIMQRLEIIGPPPHRAEPPVPVIRHFEFHSAAIGNPRHFSPLVSESFEWSRLIIYDVLRLQCDIHSFERVYEAKIDIKKRKSIDLFVNSSWNEYTRILDIIVSWRINWWNDKDKTVFSISLRLNF